MYYCGYCDTDFDTYADYNAHFPPELRDDWENEADADH